MNSTSIPIANADWALNAFVDADRQIAIQLLQHETPTLILVYIARRRELDPDRRWNWCSACHVEIKVRHVHRSIVQCPSCLRHFEEAHEGTSENERLRSGPGYSGPYHYFTSAIWHEWSLRLVRGDVLSDGSLAYDVTPFELPTRTVDVGERKLSRRERRQLARRGVRGRRGSKPVAIYQKAYKQEPYEPESWREHALVEPRSFTSPRFDERIYQRKSIDLAVRICERCRCEIRLFVTLYLEREAPQLTQCITRGLRLAARRFGSEAVHHERCLCKR
jgi:hypothetical protein